MINIFQTLYILSWMNLVCIGYIVYPDTDIKPVGMHGIFEVVKHD